MDLFSSLDLAEGGIVSFVGGGGKTTLMLRLAEEIPPQYTALVTTTTKIYVPPQERYPCFIMGEKNFEPEDLLKVIQTGVKPALGSERLKENKLRGVTAEQFDQLRGWGGIDFILVEADGSKGLPLKGHLNCEPVIPQATTLLAIVIGADVLGKTLNSEHVHHPEVVAQLTGRKLGSIIDSETIASLITHPRGIMHSSPATARNVVIINKVDCLDSLEVAYRTGQLLVGDKIQKVILGSALSRHPIIDIITK